jgi:hypothetical protein
MGGMGNQMFQYALGRALSLKYKIPMCLDLSYLQRRDMPAGFVYRDYSLDVFNVDANVVTECPAVRYTVTETNTKFLPHITRIYDWRWKRASMLLEGYWQCDKYFINHEETIRKDFTFKHPIQSGREKDLLDEIRSCTSVAINIRRADYLYDGVHGVYGREYVDSSIDVLCRQIRDPVFYVFSDDLEWCRANLTMRTAKIVDHGVAGKKFDHYLELMSNCRHFIIPNSTFAWWAAWLSRSQGKIVIAPKRWLAKGDTDIVHDEMKWVKN